MSANDFYADQHETHLYHEQCCQWERTLQAGDADAFTPQELAPYQPTLPGGSYADSLTAVRDIARFWAVLATLFTDEELQELRAHFQIAKW